MNVVIENICSDFFTFWEQAKARPFEEQWHLWQTLYEARHPEILESYYQCFPLAKEPARVRRMFQRFDEVMPAMQQLARQIEPLITHAVRQSASLLDLPHFVLPYVVMVGLFYSDGWSTTRFQNRRTSFVALEDIVAKYPSLESHFLEILLTHEAAHSHHYQCNESTWRTHHIGEALFLEGLAVFVSAQAVPGQTMAEYLWFQKGYEEWLSACEHQWPQLREQLLQDFEMTERTCFANYFHLREEGPFPPRSGYYAGYRAVSVLGQQYSLIEMAHWNLPFAAEKLRHVLQEH